MQNPDAGITTILKDKSGTLCSGEIQVLTQFNLFALMADSDRLSVATGFPGVDMPTFLLPNVIPEVDTNPMSFYAGVTITQGISE